MIGQAVLGTDESGVKFLSGISTIGDLSWGELIQLSLATGNGGKRLRWNCGSCRVSNDCAAAAYYLLGWEVMPSWLAGVAMSTTSSLSSPPSCWSSVSIRTEYGKTVLAACFITDLGTVVALGLIFALVHAQDRRLPW